MEPALVTGYLLFQGNIRNLTKAINCKFTDSQNCSYLHTELLVTNLQLRWTNRRKLLTRVPSSDLRDAQQQLLQRCQTPLVARIQFTRVSHLFSSSFWSDTPSPHWVWLVINRDTARYGFCNYYFP